MHHLTSHQIYTSHLLILSSSLKLLSRSYIFLSVAFYLLEYSRSWYCVRMSPKVISSSVCLNCVFPLKLMYLIENQFYVSPYYTHMIVFFYFVFLFQLLVNASFSVASLSMFLFLVFPYVLLSTKCRSLFLFLLAFLLTNVVGM